MSAAQPWAAGPPLPSLADLNLATRETAAVLNDPASSLQEVQRAAELEAATLHAYWHSGRVAQAELEIHGPEAEI
jgi:hypothetical protein